MPPDYNAYWLNPVAYDKSKFLAELAIAFSSRPHYNAGAAQHAVLFLRMIEQDRDIADLRWAAYMLATTMWETTTPHRTERVALNKKGHPIKNKRTGKVVMVKVTRWQMTMAPVSEVGHGKGRRYHESVKIKVLDNGSARITEHDGDQFTVQTDGNIKPMNKGAKMGAKDGAPTSSVFDSDDGFEQVFYGRGYVQLTWWSNYAKAGIAIGRGLDLLLDPDAVKTPAIAFEIMALGMLTGTIFANGNKLSDFISGANCDYEGARATVNGTDHAADIAALASKLQEVLMKSKG